MSAPERIIASNEPHAARSSPGASRTACREPGGDAVLASQTQITKHHCIQGWSGIAAGRGVRLADVLARCGPLPAARFIVFQGFDEHVAGQPYYETIDLELAMHDQTILAYEMNGEPLSVPHGAPCRLRVETQLGFKMVELMRSKHLIAVPSRTARAHALGERWLGSRAPTRRARRLHDVCEWCPQFLHCDPMRSSSSARRATSRTRWCFPRSTRW